MPQLILPGGKPVTAIKVGTTDFKQIRIGSTLYWSKAMISDGFDPDGPLQRWINELRSGDLGALCTDVTGVLTDGLGNVVGSTVAFVEGGLNGSGKLVAQTGQNLADAYCGLWGGTAAPDGLIGLVNGIPIIGGFLADWLRGDIDIESIIGQIPIVGEIGRLIGLFPDVEGNILDPLNFVVDAFGNVIGTITCGEFKPTGGIFEGICFLIGVVGNAAKMMIPDGLMSLNKQVSRMRHPDLLPGDDGHLEVQIAEVGSPNYVTQVYRRYANDNSGARGVGMDFRNSQVSIVRRVAGAEVLVKPNLTSFGPSDTCRLIQTGNLHTLVKNGDPVGEWNDAAATAAKGSANRSVAMWMQGAKELTGSRLFSPSLNYLEAA
ncbi:minor tail protein [Mycobacterium phage LilMcDreamy]|uniref:Uncharacterized protein n=1 Tax=Mycobacterium phage LilMcDreamy TaxID=2652422 RepID=A0A5P8D6P3_9CAUD|nr:minor tail protein [Mycobacterium phage LilMcDreamy]QFP94658.1 hypothetical protein SEA_LILMCDREAMY_38 [Mycobacterium phage LilMcDreamy]